MSRRCASRPLRLLAALAVVTMLCSCVRVDNGVRMPTFGEQFVDLASAYEAGLMTEDEFVRARRRLLRSLLH